MGRDGWYSLFNCKLFLILNFDFAKDSFPNQVRENDNSRSIKIKKYKSATQVKSP